MTGQNNDDTNDISRKARRIVISDAIVKGPLGIMAFFVAFVEVMSAAVIGWSADKITELQLWALIVFVIIFPILLLWVLRDLVIHHHEKLWSPEYFDSDDSYLALHRRIAYAAEQEFSALKSDDLAERFAFWLKDENNLEKYRAWRRANNYGKPTAELLYSDRSSLQRAAELMKE